MKRKIIKAAIIGGLVLYVLDGLLYFFLTDQDQNLLQVLLTEVPVKELYSRMILFTGIILFGFIITAFVNDLILENEFIRKQQERKGNGSMDSDFISGLSYQIRTPLNAIVGFSELLKDPNLSIQSKQVYINHIHSSGSYLLQLLSNLTDITRLESNQLNLDKTDTRIYGLFEELKDHFGERKKEAGKENVEIILDHGVEDPDFTIIIDNNRFRQVLTNLLENALKYTGEGHIKFGYKVKDENQLEVFVIDTGQGFSRDRLEMILNRYKNLTDNQHQPFDGVALRLTISKNMVKVMGGDLSAESSLGKGSSFRFNLPFEESVIEPIDIEEDDITSDDIAGPRDWEDKTILIAEDVESNFIYLQELLRPTRAHLI
ncbi:MAG: sensor histidine kinase, partial [Bacteroidales bacterium]